MKKYCVLLCLLGACLAALPAHAATAQQREALGMAAGEMYTIKAVNIIRLFDQIKGGKALVIYDSGCPACQKELKTLARFAERPDIEVIVLFADTDSRRLGQWLTQPQMRAQTGAPGQTHPPAAPYPVLVVGDHKFGLGPSLAQLGLSWPGKTPYYALFDRQNRVVIQTGMAQEADITLDSLAAYLDGVPLTEAIGLGRAEFETGQAWQQGTAGKRKDLQKAAQAYYKAAQKGHVTAMFELGRLYAEGGDNFTPDPAKAFTWYREAVRRGHTPALVELAHLYALGRGTDKSPQKAFDIYKELAERPPGKFKAVQNTARAALGGYYLIGEAGEQNPERAYVWSVMALNDGDIPTRFRAMALQNAQAAGETLLPERRQQLDREVSEKIGKPVDFNQTFKSDVVVSALKYLNIAILAVALMAGLFVVFRIIRGQKSSNTPQDS